MQLVSTAAVDAHVGQHLFEECVMDLKRRGKCVILVTNALQFLKQSSHILVLKDGRISESGVYEDLLRNGKGFTEMIATMQDTSSGSTTGGEGAEGESEKEAAGEADGADGDIAKTRSRSVSGGKKRSNSVPAEEDAKVNLKKSANLIATEDRETGDVSYKVYGKWAVAAGGLSVGTLPSQCLSDFRQSSYLICPC
jgi:ABC-type multidrug transport system ATPase subunit